MEVRIRSILLILSLVLPYQQLIGAETADQELKPVIQPEIERREFQESRIDTEDFEVTGFIGIMGIEDFGSNPVYGFKLGYHVSEELFIEGTIGQSEAGKTSIEKLLPGGTELLSDDERTFTYYNVSLGFNLLPGEVFPTKNVSYNSDIYLIAGVGSTEFAGADRFTINFGFGYRLYLTDYLAVRTDFQDLMLNVDVTGEDKSTHNLQFTFGLAYFF